MAKKTFLESISSPRPCAADWNEMSGDERVRFCHSCEKDVYNLSAMPRREARKLVAQNAGKICVRYVRLADGRVQTLDSKLYKITRRASTVAAGVFGAALTLSSITNAQTPAPETKPAPTKAVKSQTLNDSETSRISFTVYDPNNMVVPSAEVKLTNLKTQEEFTGLTDEYGAVHLHFIPPGRYEIEFSAKGFNPWKRTIQIKEKIEPNIKVTLDVGSFVGVVVVDWSEIPLFRAIAQEDNETVKNAINSGFKVNTKDSENNTALHVAVEHGNLEIVKLLLERGANVNVKNKYKLTPIWKIEDGDEPEKALEIFRLLIAKGADVNVLNEDKETLLMLACEDNNLEFVKMLLEAGANPNLKDEDDETPLQRTDSDEIKALLKKHGAK